ncbi:MAG: damage-inducible protein CinA [Opitutia bacterium]|nr:MAG: damage-inducible protein CinA [Opitutae bacterium]
MLSCNSQPRQVLVINVGDELLDGIRENGHLLWLGEQLARRGLPITRSIVVRDNANEIAREVGEAWGAYDLIVTTGGIGPTSDDHVRAAVASALGLKLEHVPSAEQALRERFKLIGRKLSEADLSQCFIPTGAEALPNPRGTSPGVFYHRDGKALVMLPGPTLELRPMFEEEVVPRLRDVGCACQGEAYVQVRTFGIGAVPLEEIVRPFLKPGMVLSFGTHTGVVDARISSAGSGFTAEELCEVARQVRDAVGHDFVCTGHACLASLVVEQLRSLEKTVALAESCTGGLLANSFTNVPGASKVFAGSAVCYANDAKVNLLGIPECLIAQHGAVSAECAAAMATCTIEKFGSDYAISVTGYAGPGGGTEADPVGTVYIGYASPAGVWSRRVVLPGDRRQVKLRAVNTALDFMRRQLNKYRIEDLIHGA